MSLSSQNLEVIRRVTSLLSPSKSMQFCNEQIRTQPLFSPPCANATYGSARMCRRKNVCFFVVFFPASQPPVSALYKRGQRRRAWKRQQKQRRRNEWLCRLCGPGNTVTRTSLVLCVRVCVFCFTDIAFSEGGSAVDQTHTKCASDCAWELDNNIAKSLTVITQLWPSMSSMPAYLQIYAMYKVGRGRA